MPLPHTPDREINPPEIIEHEEGTCNYCGCPFILTELLTIGDGKWKHKACIDCNKELEQEVENLKNKANDKSKQTI